MSPSTITSRRRTSQFSLQFPSILEIITPASVITFFMLTSTTDPIVNLLHKIQKMTTSQKIIRMNPSSSTSRIPILLLTLTRPVTKTLSIRTVLCRNIIRRTPYTVPTTVPRTKSNAFTIKQLTPFLQFTKFPTILAVTRTPLTPTNTIKIPFIRKIPITLSTSSVTEPSTFLRPTQTPSRHAITTTFIRTSTLIRLTSITPI